MPKGVKASLIFLYGPLCLMTGSLVLTQFTSVYAFNLTAKTCLRLLALNIGFTGAINYGIGGALYEISNLAYLKRLHSYQIMYSFLPGILAFGAIQMLLMSPIITQTQLITT